MSFWTKPQRLGERDARTAPLKHNKDKWHSPQLSEGLLLLGPALKNENFLLFVVVVGRFFFLLSFCGFYDPGVVISQTQRETKS